MTIDASGGGRAGRIARANRELAGAPVEEVLRWAVEEFAGDRLGVVSAFGPGSLVILHHLYGLGVRLPVVFVDTLHHFPQTLEHVERVRARYHLDLRIHRAAASRDEFERLHGERLWELDGEKYQQVAKVEPFLRGTSGLDAWLTGRRREQAATRTVLALVEDGEKVRVNPLVAWTHGEVWRYILDRGIPYNPLHDQGYASIGDEPLTTPVGADEHERAGRWRGQEKTECGIHAQYQP